MTSSWASAPTSRVHARFETFLTLRKIFSGTPCLTVRETGAATTASSASVHGPVGAGAAGEVEAGGPGAGPGPGAPVGSAVVGVRTVAVAVGSADSAVVWSLAARGRFDRASPELDVEHNA